jgi:hypothetical protein
MTAGESVDPTGLLLGRSDDRVGGVGGSSMIGSNISRRRSPPLRNDDDGPVIGVDTLGIEEVLTVRIRGGGRGN